MVFFARETRVNKKTSTIQTQRSPPQESQSAHRRLFSIEDRLAFLLIFQSVEIVLRLQGWLQG